MKIKYLAGIILIFALAACGNDGVKSGTSPKPQGGEVNPQVGEANRQGGEANSQGNEGSAPSMVKWVAVGDSITLSSEDGISWTEKVYGENARLYSVYYADSKWIAVGQQGSNSKPTAFILSSTNGINWTDRSPKDTNAKLFQGFLRGVYYADSKWIAVGQQGSNSKPTAFILSSTNGINWTDRSPKDASNAPIEGFLRGVYYGDSKWIAVGSDASATAAAVAANGIAPLALSSSKGDTWENVVINFKDFFDGFLYGIAYGVDRWITVGGGEVSLLLLESTSGLSGSWISKIPTGVKVRPTGIAYGADTWIAVGRGTILKRTNAAWSTIDTSAITDFTDTTNLLDVVHANGQFIAIGGAGAILTSPDGDAWTKLDSKTTKHLYGIAYRE